VKVNITSKYVGRFGGGPHVSSLPHREHNWVPRPVRTCDKPAVSCLCLGKNMKFYFPSSTTVFSFFLRRKNKEKKGMKENILLSYSVSKIMNATNQ